MTTGEFTYEFEPARFPSDKHPDRLRVLFYACGPEVVSTCRKLAQEVRARGLATQEYHAWVKAKAPPRHDALVFVGEPDKGISSETAAHVCGFNKGIGVRTFAVSRQETMLGTFCQMWTHDLDRIVEHLVQTALKGGRYVHPRPKAWELRERAPIFKELRDFISAALGAEPEPFAHFREDAGPSSFQPDFNPDHYKVTVDLLQLMALPMSGWEWVHYMVASEPASELRRIMREEASIIEELPGMRRKLDELKTKQSKALSAWSAATTDEDRRFANREHDQLREEIGRLEQAIQESEERATELRKQRALAQALMFSYDRKRVPMLVEVGAPPPQAPNPVEVLAKKATIGLDVARLAQQSLLPSGEEIREIPGAYGPAGG